MCGRYGSFSATTAVAEAFAAHLAPDAAELKPSGNMAPGMDVAVIVQRPDRRLHAARWGMVPPWATDPADGYRAFNARSETADTKPTFRGAMRDFRVVVPASCWYEWATGTVSRAGAHASKEPYAVRRANGALLALAGLCSWWRVPERPDRPVHGGPALHGPWLLTCTILTRDAGTDLSWLHPREPVLLADDVVDAWLSPSLREGSAAGDLLRSPRPDLTWERIEPRTLRQPLARPVVSGAET